MKDKMKCIKNIKTLEVRRLTKSECDIIINSDFNKEWVYTTKGVYKRFVKLLNKQHNTSGSNSGRSRDGKKSKNRLGSKSTKYGKDISQQIIPQHKLIVDDIYKETYESVKHLLSIDPITGAKIYAKEGKAKRISRTLVFNKGELVKIKSKVINHEPYFKPDKD